jgi:hypothetical protein
MIVYILGLCLLYFIIIYLIPCFYYNYKSKEITINNIFDDKINNISFDINIFFNYKIFFNYIFLFSIIINIYLYFECLFLDKSDLNYQHNYNKITNYITILNYIIISIFIYFLFDILYYSKNNDINLLYNQWSYLFLIIIIFINIISFVNKGINLLLKNDIFNSNVNILNFPKINYWI